MDWKSLIESGGIRVVVSSQLLLPRLRDPSVASAAPEVNRLTDDSHSQGHATTSEEYFGVMAPAVIIEWSCAILAVMLIERLPDGTYNASSGNDIMNAGRCTTFLLTFL